MVNLWYIGLMNRLILLLCVVILAFSGCKKESESSSTMTIPSDLGEKKVGSLGDGESGWCVWWTMWLDIDSKCWINGYYTVTPDKVNNDDIKVTRKGVGYIVKVNVVARWKCNNFRRENYGNGPYVYDQLPVYKIEVEK